MLVTTTLWWWHLVVMMGHMGYFCWFPVLSGASVGGGWRTWSYMQFFTLIREFNLSHLIYQINQSVTYWVTVCRVCLVFTSIKFCNLVVSCAVVSRLLYLQVKFNVWMEFSIWSWGIWWKLMKVEYLDSVVQILGDQHKFWIHLNVIQVRWIKRQECDLKSWSFSW